MNKERQEEKTILSRCVSSFEQPFQGKYELESNIDQMLLGI